MRPGDVTWKKVDQTQLLTAIRRVLALPHRVSGDHVFVTEVCRPPKNGFPGRLSSSTAAICGPIRANLLSESADADMSMCMHRVLLWLCNQFGIAVPQLEYYVNHRDGPGGMLQRLMGETGCSKAKAKQLFTSPYTACKPVRVNNAFHKALDQEAKAIQRALIAVPEFQWILPYCKDANRPGSFMAHLYHWVECKLLVAVSAVISNEFNVAIAALVTTVSMSQTHRCITTWPFSTAHTLCVRVFARALTCGGHGNRSTSVSNRSTSSTQSRTWTAALEVRVPDGYVAPPVGGPNAPELGAAVAFGPSELRYEQLREAFSLGFNGPYGKVVSTYIKRGGDGSVVPFEARRFKEHHRYLVYLDAKTKKVDGVLVTTNVAKPFIEQWMNDHRMDARYIEDQSRGCYWELFYTHPDRDKCPSDVFGLWSGFAAENIEIGPVDDIVRGGLLAILEHLNMLCSGDVDQYGPFLDLLAHGVQFPATKVGIAICFVGPQGCGKGTVWDIIGRVVGERGCFSTTKPERDVVGKFNGAMKDASFVRVAECNKKNFEGVIGELRGMFTDGKIDVYEKYCNAINVKSYARFFLDTNFTDAIPDEHGERRYFIIKCSSAMLGHEADYFAPLHGHIADDRVIRSFYEFLLVRSQWCSRRFVVVVVAVFATINVRVACVVIMSRCSQQ